MKFTETFLPGSYMIELEKHGDERGFFARLFCEREFGALGLDTNIVQINNSLSRRQGTLRGMHYQLPPSAEAKVVRCISGAFWDVILDLRSDSPTFGRHFGFTLSAENRLMVYVPKGCAHGFITLEDDSEMLYLASALYAPELERGVRWNDPGFAIEWPIEPVIISERDRAHPDFDPAQHLPR